MRRVWVLAILLAASGCGRYFAGPLRPLDRQASGMTVNDDGSVTFALERLRVTLQPMTDAQLNRQFAGVSSRQAASTNPYTFGNWTPMGDAWTPPRFAVFLLKVSNYEYPKVLVDPAKARITTTNNRAYRALSYAELDEYYRAYWLGRTGVGGRDFESRTDLLRRTQFARQMVFSGQEQEGYLVFPVLDDDVEEVRVHLPDIVLRFDFADQPVESTDISFSFHRDVVRAYQSPAELARQD
ncbi:MAG: hypothetical protein AB1505_10300 [Candidatus Latescibacterota bacterium]